jgi:curli biogenesis system outer membrane secretion channel CsgG
MKHALSIVLAAVQVLALGGLGPPALAQPSQATSASRQAVTVEGFDGADIMGGAVSGEGLSAMLIDVLVAEGRFSVMERGSTRPRFHIKGAITRYDPIAGGAGVQVGGMSALGRALGAGAKTRMAKVALSLRLIDPTTGEVIAVARGEGAASAQEADAGLLNGRDGSTVGASAFRATSVGKAVEDAMRKAATELATKAPA